MSARPRDIVKSRAQRISEITAGVWLKNGTADGEAVIFGGNVTFTTATLNISDTTAVIAGAFVDKAAVTAVAAPAGAATSTGQECQFIVELDASGTITTTAGAVASTGLSVPPAETATRVTLATVKVPASFVPGTTSLAGAVITKTPYFT